MISWVLTATGMTISLLAILCFGLAVWVWHVKMEYKALDGYCKMLEWERDKMRNSGRNK